MLDIDLNFLKFLLEPSYEYIKDDIKIIQDAYLEDTSSNEKDKKFNNVIYLFCNTLEELESFLKKIRPELIKDVYNRFANFFEIVLTDKYGFICEENSFIEKILSDNGIYELFGRELEINIFKNEIRNYLINIINTSDNENYKNKADEALQYMDLLIKQYDDIYKVLEPKLNFFEYLKNKKNKIAVEIMKEIMLENMDLLDRRNKKLINESDEYDEIRESFNLNFGYFLREISSIRPNAIFKLGIRARIGDLNNDDRYTSDGITYYGDEVLNALEYDLQKYNEIYCEECEMIEKEFFTEELKKQIATKGTKYLTESEISEIINYIYKYLKEEPYVLGSNIFTSSHQNFVVCKLLKTLKIKNSKILCSFYHNLSHELGHVYDGFLFNLHNTFEREFNILGEAYIDYRSIKLTDELIYSKKINKDGLYLLNCYSKYSNHFFLLIDIFEKYKSNFDDFLKFDSMSPLGDLMGRDLLFELIEKQENFDLNKARSDYEYANYYLEYADNLLEKVEEKQKLRKK